MSNAGKHLIVGVGVGVGVGVVVRCIGIGIGIVGYGGGGELVFILPQGQGAKGADMIYIHTCIHMIYKEI